MLKLISSEKVRQSYYLDLFQQEASPYVDVDYFDALQTNWMLAFDEASQIGIPLAVGKKIGLQYTYQAPLVQKYAFIGTNAKDVLAQQSLMHQLPAYFKLTEINIPTSTIDLANTWKTRVRRNAVLDLNLPYDELFSSFGSNHKRNLAKADKLGLEVLIPTIEEAKLGIATFLSSTTSKFQVQKGYGKAFYNLIDSTLYPSKLEAFQIFQNESLLAMAIVFRNKGYLVNLLSFATDLGRESNALFLLMDAIIRKNANKPLMLDFEGSDNDGIFRFYKGFGAQNIPYLHVRNNNLPPLLRWLKK